MVLNIMLVAVFVVTISYVAIKGTKAVSLVARTEGLVHNLERRFDEMSRKIECVSDQLNDASKRQELKEEEIKKLRDRIDCLIDESADEKEQYEKTQNQFMEGYQNLMNYNSDVARSAK